MLPDTMRNIICPKSPIFSMIVLGLAQVVWDYLQVLPDPLE